MKTEKGFSLIELLIVVAILGIIAALAVPGLKRARQHARSASAVQSLRMITTAEHLYERRYKVFANLIDLAPEATLDLTVVSGYKSGYTFTLTLGVDSKSFTCIATPEEEPTITTHFYVDTTGVIRYEEGAPADASSSPVPR